MDKKKTGCLIKKARTKKNYTQSELGDLLGVTNKAVSRWENGDSFPDVGILENLVAVLDLRIQDIVTGDTEIHDEFVVTEVVRVAKLQQKEKQRIALKNSLFIIALLCCLISGYSALGNNILFADTSILMYIILMVFSFALILSGYASQSEDNKKDITKLSKCTKIVSALSLTWCILMTWSVFLMVINGHIPFGIEPSSIGPFINWQFVILYIINLVITTLEVYKYIKIDATIHWGWFLSIATMYITILYGDMLHRMTSPQKAIESLVVRTLVILIAVGISLVLAKIIKSNTNRISNNF